MTDAILVTTPAALQDAILQLGAATRLAIDTEFMRESTYFAQLCLLQIASDRDCYLVDPLAGLDLAPLHALLTDPSRPKIVHSARQDLEVLCQASGRVPGPIFDTQVAAALLGLAPQIGYAELVARRLGHSIDKGQTRTDWSRRPLSPEQLAYAADDVRHLLELHSQLEAELLAAGRAHWLREECAALEDPSLYRPDGVDTGRRLKALNRLSPREQQVARALARWREERAVSENRPRGWLLADDAIYALASLQPATLEALAEVRALPPAVLRRRGAALLEVIADALQAPPAGDGSEPAPHRKPTPEENARASRLMQTLRDEATRLGISAEILATRREVDALARGETVSTLCAGWRGEVLGPVLRGALEA